MRMSHSEYHPILMSAHQVLQSYALLRTTRFNAHAYTLMRGSLSSPNSTPCGDAIECNVRIARAQRCRTGSRHGAISLASHTSL